MEIFIVNVLKISNLGFQNLLHESYKEKKSLHVTKIKVPELDTKHRVLNKTLMNKRVV